jgi:hypothetical protein
VTRRQRLVLKAWSNEALLRRVQVATDNTRTGFMRTAMLLPLIVLGLAGCVHVDRDRPPVQSSTVVTPAPAPQATYTTPPGSTTTVVRP